MRPQFSVAAASALQPLPATANRSYHPGMPDNTPSLIEPGSKAPAFKLPDKDGKTHQLKDYKGKWVVLYFYPKDNTSGCTKQACQFRDAQADLKNAGAVVLGVSPDDTKSHTKFAADHSLPFPLLADTDQTVCKAFGVWQEKSMYGRKYMGVVRTTYLIDPEGKVAHRFDKVKVPAHDTAVLKQLETLKT